MTQLSPMAVCERLIGPPEKIAEITGCQPKSPYGWRGNSANRDAGDIPSARHMRALLAHAVRNNLPIEPLDLIFGLPESVLDARLRAAEPAGQAA